MVRSLADRTIQLRCEQAVDSVVDRRGAAVSDLCRCGAAWLCEHHVGGIHQACETRCEHEEGEAPVVAPARVRRDLNKDTIE